MQLSFLFTLFGPTVLQPEESVKEVEESWLEMNILGWSTFVQEVGLWRGYLVRSSASRPGVLGSNPIAATKSSEV